MKGLHIRPLKKRQRLRYAAETALAYAIYGFFRVLPPQAASAVGGKVLACIGPRMGITRVAWRNLDIAFPDKPAREKEEIIRGMWENLGRVIAEYPHLPRLRPRITLVGAEHFDTIRQSGKPAIFFGGHLGNWEIGSLCAREASIPVHVVYRKPNNPWVDGLLRRARGGAEGHIQKGARGARDILTCLKNNEVLGMLVDQKLNEGELIPFFGQPVKTGTAIAQFAFKFDCLLYPVRTERLDGAHFKVTVLPALSPVRTGDEQADRLALMTEIHHLLEDWIRDKPAQWLWIHKRWPGST